ncbi:hypothetical protein PALU110988_30135 [Paenibacillus lupini]|uniref:hypothetical protein n=1 Tax=Paenibacillus lupini TaxID=1450204 RepID=UPI00141E2240|nr:hypothetical protein [Paenibacillus lupini]NIK24158.1 Leu/Phe-tRNA-protein transferase [Paenibacillus lupini]
MFKLTLAVGVYFFATLLMGYYFIGVSFIKSIEMASLITIIHIVTRFIDKLYKKETTISGE